MSGEQGGVGRDSRREPVMRASVVVGEAPRATTLTVEGRLAGLLAHLAARGRKRDLDGDLHRRGKVTIQWDDRAIRSWWESQDEVTMT